MGLSLSSVPEVASDMAAVIVDAAHPKRVILFGSRARGDATAESDFDLMVVEEQPGDRYQEMVRLRRLLRGFRVSVDVLVVSENKYEYWRDTPGNVYHQAATEGVTLYEAA